MLKTRKESGALNEVPLIPPVDHSSRTPLLISCLFVLVASLAGGLFWITFNSKAPTVVALDAISPGQKLTAENLTVIESSGSLNRISSIDEVIGRTATNALEPGDLVSLSDLERELSIPRDKTVIGLLLQPGAYPTQNAKQGDRVNIYSGSGEGSLLAENVKIFDVSGLDIDAGIGNGEVLYSFEVSVEEAKSVAVAANNEDAIRISLRGFS